MRRLPVGAVLSHRMVDGSEKPIAFASRSLTSAEKSYTQLEKEGLAVVFRVKRFHQYLYGRRFVIYSDHKPLKHLFSEDRPVPQLASARIQRWAHLLSAYDYSIAYRPGSDHANADLLSRLPLPEAPDQVPVLGDTILLMDTLEGTPVTASHIRTWTSHDQVLSTVLQKVQQGWKGPTDDVLQPYARRKDKLSVQDGCILWGNRVIVPPQGRSKVIDELHEGHPGMTRMKQLARSFVWWPGIDKDLEERVKSCDQCQRTRGAPTVAPLHPWEWPGRPWTRVHVDHAGPFLGKLFLVVIDAHSKWLEVVVVSSTTSAATTKALRSIFATHGLPEILVSDNGPAFTSIEFKTFLKENGIRHITTAPYHPAGNGLAERAVQTFKQALKKEPTVDLDTQLSKFLFRYRMTPHATAGVPPAELLMQRKLRSRLDLLKPQLTTTVHLKQSKQKLNHDKSTPLRQFQIDEAVYVQDLPSRSTWLPGTVVKIRGPLTYDIALEDGRIVTRHVDNLRRQHPQTTSLSSQITTEDDCLPTATACSDHSSVTETTNSATVPLRRSTRVTRPPDRYM